jgi:Arc/MetJ-type ribon-helix-helix transcriptional regulator
MGAVQIPDDLKQVIDRQVAEGRAASAAEFVEAAVRRYALDLEFDDVEAVAAAEQGLAALKEGDYATIDDRQSRRAFWEEVSRDVSARLTASDTSATDVATPSNHEEPSLPE